jgi:hypothetical protein
MHVGLFNRPFVPQGSVISTVINIMGLAHCDPIGFRLLIHDDV